MRVHQLAKELGVETKEVITRLEKMGTRGKKAQSAIEETEVAKIRTALMAAERPQVVVGEERVVADRVVAQEDEVVGEIKTHEKIVERRVRSNVIRRRTSREEIVPEAPPPTVEPPKVSVEEEAQPANAPATRPLPEEAEHPAIQKEEAPSEKAGSPEPISATPAPDQGESERPVE